MMTFPEQGSEHWSDKYIGKPWVAYASGPDAYDCWGLVHAVLRDHYGLAALRHEDVVIGDTTIFHCAVLAEIASGCWRQVSEPEEGCVVLMARRRCFSHIGIFTAGVVLHTRVGAASCRERLSTLQRLGFNKMEYWRHESLSGPA